MLDRYFGRTDIETAFKTPKEYLSLLPLCKWDNTRVRGKILNDVIALTLYLQMRKKTAKTPYSVPEIITRSQSLMCFRKDDEIFIEKPRKQLAEILNGLGIPVLSKLSLPEFGTR